MHIILNLVCCLPLAGAVLILLVKRHHERAIKLIATITALLGFLASIPLLTSFNNPRFIGPDGYRFIYDRLFIPQIGVYYRLGIDGISLLFILLTGLLGVVAILASWSAVIDRLKEYYGFMLLLQMGILGAFMALDFLVFFMFWGVMLISLSFLIGSWGGAQKNRAAKKFIFYNLAGSALILTGILLIYFYQHSVTGMYSFDIAGFQKLGFPIDLQLWFFLVFSVGFAITVPMIPFHDWLPKACVEVPAGCSIILTGLLMKVGAYGFIRFALPLFPWAAMHFLKPMLMLSLAGIVYCGIKALLQKDMKSLLAYYSISHLGLVMLGIFTVTPGALQGSIIHMINHGIIAGALFLVAGALIERHNTSMISDQIGLRRRMPIGTIVLLIFTLSAVGVPLLNGYTGIVRILKGIFAESELWIYAAIAIIGIVLGVIYLLRLSWRVVFSNPVNHDSKAFSDLSLRELAAVAPLIVLTFWIGINPAYFTKYLDEPVNAIVERVRVDYLKTKAAALPQKSQQSAISSRQ